MVDDEQFVLDAYQRSLRGQFQLVTAKGAEQAALALRTIRFSVVVTDFRMPGKNGLSVLELARSLQPAAIRLVTSGYTDILEMTDLFKEMGVSQVLVKPCGREQMTAELRVAIDRFHNATVNRDMYAAVRTISAMNS